MVEHGEYQQDPWTLFDKPKPVPLDRDLESRLFLQFVTKGSRNWDTELEIADDIYQRNLQGLPYNQAFQKFLGIFLRVSDIHLPLEKANKPRSVFVLNSVQSHLADALAIDYARAVPRNYMQKLYEQAENLEYSRNRDQWFFPKVRNLTHRLESFKKTYEWIDLLKSRIRVSPERISLPELQEASGEILRRIKEERGYGVKSCYFFSPLFLKDSDVFIALDEMLGLEDARFRGRAQTDIMANIAISNKPRGPLDAEVIEEEFTSKTKATMIRIAESFALFSIDNAGEFRTGLFSRVPLKRVFERENASIQYELWRAFMLTRLYDLTRRAGVVAKMPSVDAFEKGLVKEGQGFFGRQKGVKSVDYKTLMLPRIKYIDQEPSTQIDDVDKERRFVDRHKVTWFTRRLPLNYHATQRAIDYAQENGVSLKDNETIVREHYRGSTEEQAKDKPTKARFRV